MQSKMTQNENNERIENRVEWWLLGAEEHCREMSSERVQTSSYKINK